MTADEAASPVLTVERAFCRLFEAMQAEDGEQVWIAQEPMRLPGQYQHPTNGGTFDLGPPLDDDVWRAMQDLYDGIYLTPDNTDSPIPPVNVPHPLAAPGVVPVPRNTRQDGDDTETEKAASPIFSEWQIDTPVHEAVFQALGAASMCWSTPEGAGVFDSTRAAAIGDELMALLQRKLWTQDNPDSPVEP